MEPNIPENQASDPTSRAPESLIGRYELFDSIGVGGMAKVQLGRLLGPAGFTKPVAVKRLHEHLIDDPEFVNMILDEARLAARVRHPNVVSTLDVVQTGGEVFLVLDYVEGESLSKLLTAAAKAGEPVDQRIASAILVNAAQGLHAAHQATDENGELLGLVHRDVSPQNILVGVDGIARVLDFGIAKGAGRDTSTRDGRIKGKVRYMPPEQVEGEPVDARADVYALSALLWEALTFRRLVDGPNEVANIGMVLAGKFPSPGSINPAAAPFDEVTMRGLATAPGDRHESALEFAKSLESVVGCAPNHEVGEWVKRHAGPALAERALKFRAMEAFGSEERSSAAIPISAGPGSVTPPAASMPITPEKPKRSGTAVAILLALLTFGALSLGAVMLFGGQAPNAGKPAQAAPETANAKPSPEVTEPELPVTQVGEIQPEPSAADAGADAASEEAASEEVASDEAAKKTDRAVTARPRPAEPRREKRPAAEKEPVEKAPPAADCSNPFTVDKDGIKHVKSECM